MTPITNTFIQIILFIASVYLVCFIISLINRLFYKCVNGNKMVCYATGIIGTPIHELSHALFCLIFFHKINEIKLFQIDEKTGVLGYVSHSYNKRNIYHQIGNYFIGVAPIICGTLLLYLLLYLLVPNIYQDFSMQLSKVGLILEGGDYALLPSEFFKTLGIFMKSFFIGSWGNFKWWIYLVICFCIALHMNLSGADIKGSLIAIPILVILLFLINLALYFISAPIYASFLQAMFYAGSYLIGFLFLSLFLSLFVLLCGILAFVIRKLILKK